MKKKHSSKFIIHNSKFDLILVDLYLGQNFPVRAENERFLKNLKKILTKDGFIVFNRLDFGKHRKNTAVFFEKIKSQFQKVKTIKAGFNLFFVCQLA